MKKIYKFSYNLYNIKKQESGDIRDLKISYKYLHSNTKNNLYLKRTKIKWSCERKVYGVVREKGVSIDEIC